MKFNEIIDKLLEKKESDMNLFMSVAQLLSSNPTPSFEELQALSDETGVPREEIEREIYTLASILVDLFSSGKSTEAGITEDDVDPDQLAMGIEVEMEHTENPELAKKIALDHLSEFSGYYTALKEMEDKLRAEEGGDEDVEVEEEEVSIEPEQSKEIEDELE